MATSIFRKNFPQVDLLQQKADSANFIIGLDIHKKTTAITVIDKKSPNKPIFQRKRILNLNLLESILKFQGQKIVVAESAYGWYPLQQALQNIFEITFIIFDPFKTSSWIKASGIKNDKIDSEILAYACLHDGISRLAVYQPSKSAKENFKLALLREQFVRQRTKVKNQLKAIDKDFGINPYTGEIPQISESITFMTNLLLDQLNN